jgi:hypothetical protein
MLNFSSLVRRRRQPPETVAIFNTRSAPPAPWCAPGRERTLIA